MSTGVSEVLDAAVATLMSFELRHVLLVEALPGGDTVVVRAVAGEPAPLQRAEVLPRSTVPVVDGVLSSGRTINVADITSEARYRLSPVSPLAGLGSAVGVPIRVRDQTVGALVVRSLSPNVFDVHDVPSTSSSPTS